MPNLKSEMRKRVIVITGTPGVGKSSVAEELSRELKARLISVGDLVVREKLYSGYDEERKTYVADLSKVRERIQELVRQSAEDVVIIEGHYAQLVAPDDVEMVVVLRCEPNELERRLRKAGYSDEKVSENVRAEILDVCLCESVERYGGSKIFEVNTTGKSPKDVVREVLVALKEGVRRLGVVDWLGELDKKGELERFFNEL